MPQVWPLIYSMFMISTIEGILQKRFPNIPLWDDWSTRIWLTMDFLGSDEHNSCTEQRTDKIPRNWSLCWFKMVNKETQVKYFNCFVSTISSEQLYGKSLSENKFRDTSRLNSNFVVIRFEINRYFIYIEFCLSSTSQRLPMIKLTPFSEVDGV